LAGFVTGASRFFHGSVCVDNLSGIHARDRANVLKETIISGIVLAFMPRKPVPTAQVIDRAGATDVAPIPAQVAPTIGRVGTDDKWPAMTAIEAAKAFFLEMQHHAAGEALQLKWVRHSYDVLARERGWPALSDKALSMHLVAFGCKRKKVDQRKTGGGRVTAFEFPLETGAQRRRRKK
jgi:hypothetical protein